MDKAPHARLGLFAGLSTIDLIYRIPGPPAPNSKNAAASQMVFAGGPATNAAITFSILGGRARLVSALGRHPLTSVPRAEFDTYRVAFADLAPEFDGVPPVSSILVTENTGDRIVVSANAQALAHHPRALPPLDLTGIEFVLFDGHHFDVLAPLLRQARGFGIPTILDGGSWKPALASSIGDFSIVIASSNFLPPSCASHEDVLAFLRNAGVPQIAITRGEQPILAEAGGSVHEIPVPRVEAIDTLGAGDIFHGAFCAAFHRDRDRFTEALRFAARVAALSTTVRGTRAWASLPGLSV